MNVIAKVPINSRLKTVLYLLSLSATAFAAIALLLYILGEKKRS